MAPILSPTTDIQRSLRPMARRLRLRDTLRLVSRTLWMPLAASALLQVVGRLVPIANLLVWTALPLLVWVLAMAGSLLFRRMPLANVARRIDEMLGLRERLSTALELGGHADHGPVDDDQQEDARAAAARLRPNLVPLVFERRPLLLALVPLALVAASIVLPNPQAAVLAERTLVEQALTQTADQVKQVQQQVAQDQTLTPEERAALEKELADLEQKLRENNGNREQALADLSTAEARLQQRIDPNTDARRAAMEQMTRNLQSMSGAAQTQRPTMGDASSELQALADRLAQMTPEQQQQAAQALGAQAAQMAQSDPQTAQGLSSAAQALQNNDTAAAQQALEQAAQSAAQAAQQQANQQAVERSLSQVQQSREQVAQAGQQNQQGQQAQQNQQGQQGQQGQEGQEGQEGQQGQQGQGQGQQGEGQQGQQGQGGQGGQGQNPQNGGARADNLGEGQGGQSDIDPNGDSSGGSGSGNQHGEMVYQPYTPSGNPGDPDYVQGQQGTDGETQVQQGQSSLPGAANDSMVPYDQVLPEYQRSAGEALDQSAIPPHLKDYVRDYFSQLEPQR